MSEMLIAWLAFPLVLGGLSFGCGHVVQAMCGRRVSGTLILPSGFAAIIVIAQLMTMDGITAPLTIPVIVVVAAVGVMLSVPWRQRGVDPWPLAAATGSFAVVGAPILLSGSATFTGWIKLDDGATWLAFVDHLLHYGRQVDLPPSTHEVLLRLLLDTGYPVASFLPLGVAGELLREDIAWLLAPYHSFIAAMLALAVYGIASSLVRSAALRAFISFIAAQASILFGYAQWSGTKELVVAASIALLAACVPSLLEPAASPRVGVPMAIATAAIVGSLSIGGAVWLVPIVLPAAYLVFRARGGRFTLSATGWYIGATLVLSLPSLLTAQQFQPASAVLTSADLGNLFEPLQFKQVLGIWPAGDFRIEPRDLSQTYVLLAVALLAIATAISLSIRQRRLELTLYVASALTGAVVLSQFGSPWIAGKALAVASPALVAAAMIGAAALLESRLKIAGIIALMAVAGGVLWSNVLQTRDVSLAPRPELAELSDIGRRFAGQGPALMTEYSPYGVRHFLRQLDPESASEFRRRVVPLLSGSRLDKGGSADIDAFQTAAVLVYRTLVLRRSATASRPPSAYRLVHRGLHYEVWQRPIATQGSITEHLPLGTPLNPSAVPDCEDVRRLAAQAAPGGQLATVLRTATQVLDLSAVRRPEGWISYSNLPGTVTPKGAGTLRLIVTVPRDGRYSFWLGGSARNRLDVSVDSKRISSSRIGWTWTGIASPVGEAMLTKGTHSVELRYHGPGLRPGSGGAEYEMGPLIVGRETAPESVTYVSQANAQSLCGKRLDWIEAVQP